MASEVIVALDQGSGSSRALAFDRKGKVVALAQAPIRTFSPLPGHYEHDPVELALSQEGVLGAVIERLPSNAAVLGLALACQRSTVVFWDARSGRTVGRAPSWQDGRAADIVAPLAPSQERVHAATGLYLTPYYSAPKIRWFLDHAPKVRALAEAGRLRAAPVASFLLWRLTHGAVCAADPTLAQRMLLMNLGTFTWDKSLLGLFGLDQALLPGIRPSLGDWAVIERCGRRIPVVAVVGDQQAAAVGLGGGRPGSAVANYGTGAFLLRNTGSRTRPTRGLLTSVGWQARDGRACFLQEGTVHAAGSSISWLRGLGVLDGKASLDAACSASRERVWALPAIGGLGAPRWDYRTKTAFFGLSSHTRPADLARAVVEGLGLLMADIAGAMHGGGAPVGSVRVSGGLSRCDYLMQFQADVLGTRVERCAEAEATSRGAASLAAQALGEKRWAEVLARPRIERVFSPRMTAAGRKRLRADWTRFVSAQADLSRALS